jgi:hypothetical protein
MVPIAAIDLFAKVDARAEKPSKLFLDSHYYPSTIQSLSFL